MFRWSNRDNEQRVNVSSYELITSPIWLFLIGVVISSWYAYSVRIKQSINSLNVATEGETIKFRYVDTSSRISTIITSNLAVFASN